MRILGNDGELAGVLPEGELTDPRIDMAGTWLLVRPLSKLPVGSLVVPMNGSTVERPTRYGRVLARGPGAKNQRGEPVEMRWAVGDVVIYPAGMGVVLTGATGETLEAIHTENVVGRAAWVQESLGG